ncbi:MAG: hypothetical protein QM785_15280 [Pyrinomonadaceae bacterium]
MGDNPRSGFRNVRVASRRLNDLTRRIHAVADATPDFVVSLPWVVTHGYIHGIATRWVGIGFWFLELGVRAGSVLSMSISVRFGGGVAAKRLDVRRRSELRRK